MRASYFSATVCSSLVLAAGAHAGVLLNYSFDPGSTLDYGFGVGNHYALSGGFTYDTSSGAISNVVYTATATAGTFTSSSGDSPYSTLMEFIADGGGFGGFVQQLLFAHSLALGGTDPITGGRYGFPGAPDGTTTGSVTGVAVPEPSAWSLMILGFGIMGASLRRQRAVAIA